MPKIIELMPSEKEIELRNVSIFVKKTFEIRKKLIFVCVCLSCFLVYNCLFMIIFIIHVYVYGLLPVYREVVLSVYSINLVTLEATLIMDISPKGLSCKCTAKVQFNVSK